MSSILYRGVSYVCFFLAAISCFAGGGWTQGKSKGYLKLGQSALIAPNQFTPLGEIKSIPTISIYTTSAYLEYGITDRLDVIAYVPLFVRVTQNTQKTVSGIVQVEGSDKNTFLADTDLSLKYGLAKYGRFKVAVTGTLGLPLGDETEFLQTGDGEFNQMLSFDVGTSFNSFYANAMVGFNNRTNGFSDEFRAGFEVGYTQNKLTGLLRILNVTSLKNGDESTGDNSESGVFGNNVEFLSVTPEIIYSVKESFGVALSFGGAVSAKRILAGPNIAGGLFWKL